MLDRREIEPWDTGDEDLFPGLARRERCVLRVKRHHACCLRARRAATRDEFTQVVAPREHGEIEVVVLVSNGKRWNQALDANDFTIQHAIAEVLDLQNRAQRCAQEHVKRRQALLFAPGPKVRQRQCEAQVQRRAVHGVEQCETVAPQLKFLHC